jgi:hypothetical protein
LSRFIANSLIQHLDVAAFGLPALQARCALRVFLAALGPVEIIGDALARGWSPLLDLPGSDGLPGNVQVAESSTQNHLN